MASEMGIDGRLLRDGEPGALSSEDSWTDDGKEDSARSRVLQQYPLAASRRCWEQERSLVEKQ